MHKVSLPISMYMYMYMYVHVTFTCTLAFASNAFIVLYSLQEGCMSCKINPTSFAYIGGQAALPLFQKAGMWAKVLRIPASDNLNVT